MRELKLCLEFGFLQDEKMVIIIARHSKQH